MKLRLNRREVRVLMARNDIMTQAELAELLGVTRGAVNNWFRGEPIGIENVAELCKLFKCVPNDIVENYPEVLALVPA